MGRINPYLTFNGNCREAMTFYADCLGGELIFQTVGETPMAEQMPAKMKNCILHSTLTREELVLMGTDMVQNNGLIRGNAMSMELDCSSEEELRTCYARLSEGGEVTCAPQVTFWGALFGTLTDKYGNHWMLHYTFPDDE